MSFVQIFNLIESAWWTLLGAWILYRPPQSFIFLHHRTLAASLFLFGLSDLIELWSGAWWRPWWLLLLKLSCGAAISVLILLSLRRPEGFKIVSSKTDP